jgi:hypothetical protein
MKLNMTNMTAAPSVKIVTEIPDIRLIADFFFLLQKYRHENKLLRFMLL